MITPLRRWHRRLAPAGFLIALVGIGVALNARPEGFVDAARVGSPQEFTAPAGAEVVEDPEGRFAVVWAPPTADGAGGMLWLVPHGPLDAPDLLVYLGGDPAAGDPVAGEGVPTGARLLGSADPVRSTEFTLPAELATATGGPGIEARSILLYSLGHGARFASVVLDAGARHAEGN